MATPVVFNSVNYSIPAFGDVGYAQGPGNLSAYLIALATGTFQPTGGLFSLTADADFGPNFGLKSVYYKTQGTPLALTGVFRMARTEFIAWRDQANANDLELGVNASNQLTYNGVAISSSSGALIGTTLTLTATSNQMVIGTGTTTTISFTAPAASSVYTVPDVGTTASFVMTAGTQSIAGAKTFSDINLIHSAASAGSTVTTNTINSDNTNAASHARLFLSTGGASAGDPYINFLVTGVTNWAFGMDNSDSDALVITEAATLGGANNRFRIATGGNVTMSNFLGVGPIATPLVTAHFVGSGAPSAPASSGTTPASGTVVRILAASNAVLDIGSNSTTYAWLQSYDQTGMNASYPLALNPNGSQVFFPNGSAASPSISFVNDTDTGFYRTSANSVGLTLGTTLQWDFNANGTIRGQTSATNLLQPGFGSVGAPAFGFAGDEDTGMYRQAANVASIALGGVEAARFNNTGTADSNTWNPLNIFGGTPFGGGGGAASTGWFIRTTAAVSTSAIVIGPTNYAVIVVTGVTGGGATIFMDLLLDLYNITPTVVLAKNNGGPAARTYSQIGDSLTLQMASGTYSVAATYWNIPIR